MGKSKAKKQRVMQQPMMMPMQPPMMMPQFMMPQPQPLVQYQQSPSSDEESDGEKNKNNTEAEPPKNTSPIYSKSMDCLITGSARELMAMPKVRLGEALEFLVPRFDATIVADLSQESRALVIWMLAKVRPNLPVAELRVLTYLDLYTKLQNAHIRVQNDMGSEKYNEMLNGILVHVQSDNKLVIDIAKQYGFKDEYFMKLRDIKKKEIGRNTKATEPPSR